MVYDLVFCGYGVSARLLVYYLGKGFFNSKKVLVIDKGNLSRLPKYFSYFTRDNHHFTEFVLSSHKNIIINGIHTELNKFRFELVATKSLYKITEKFVSNAKYLQTEVLNIENLPKHISVNTKKGRYYARKVVDSRNIFQADCLYMTDKVSVKSNSNNDCVVFIDGLKTNGQGVCFEYRLPLKKRQEIHVVNISRHRPVEKVKFFILRNQPIIDSKDSRIINIGSRAGWVKSTTGYGIPAMLREIPRVAVSIKNDTNYSFKRAAFYDLCDRYLYDLFRNNPQRAVEFLNRFLCLNSEAILSFLDESANISQIVQLVKVMSKSHNRLN